MGASLSDSVRAGIYGLQECGHLAVKMTALDRTKLCRWNEMKNKDSPRSVSGETRIGISTTTTSSCPCYCCLTIPENSMFPHPRLISSHLSCIRPMRLLFFFFPLSAVESSSIPHRLLIVCAALEPFARRRRAQEENLIHLSTRHIFTRRWRCSRLASLPPVHHVAVFPDIPEIFRG